MMSKVSHKKNCIAIMCGGPSLERGISLNSARSVLDHTKNLCDILPIYVDCFKHVYKISPSSLYSNTPADFDFKLSKTGICLTQSELIKLLKEEALLTFPLIHGQFGEDGTLQSFLETHHIPFVGSSSQSCKAMFNKHQAAKILESAGYYTIPSLLLQANQKDLAHQIEAFIKTHQLKRMIIKPVCGGSSIGVSSVSHSSEVIDKAKQLFAMPMTQEALLEPFCEGCEFTVIVLENPDGKPVALVPSEIRISYDNGQIFDYKRKYLPTMNTQWLCPPSFNDDLIKQIQQQAQSIFQLFEMRDFARLDGWVLKDGEILFSDLNPISGMEQNSFIFQQATRMGFTHQSLIKYILNNAKQRLTPAKKPQLRSTFDNHAAEPTEKTETIHSAKPSKTVHVLFGGPTAERQVSVMSGTNIWLKLNQSKKYKPVPYFLDNSGKIWQLPYTYCLNHTTEEIYNNCLQADHMDHKIRSWLPDIHKRLAVSPPLPARPRALSKQAFLAESKDKAAFVFIGLHGGSGENGCLQKQLETYGLSYNGSGPKASALCMNKYASGQVVQALGIPKIQALPKVQAKLSDFEHYQPLDYEAYWHQLEEALKAGPYLIKPQNDGCSTGVVKLNQVQDLIQYILDQHQHRLPSPNTSSVPKADTTMQDEVALEQDAYIIEPYWETDTLAIRHNKLIHQPHNGWLELTVGVLGNHSPYRVLNPSITVTDSDILRVEEKFQGGTGINITPPPNNLMSPSAQKQLKGAMAKIAEALEIKGYARIDVFFHPITEKLIFIEANSLPALTPSTVLYHQALAETPPIYPIELLETIIDLGIKQAQYEACQSKLTQRS